MIQTQKAIYNFHKKHQFPVNISLQANKKISWLIMWFICKLIFGLSKLTIWYWKITDTNNESFYRFHLQLEELAEMMEGINNGNEVKTADGLGDLLYVVIGTAVAYQLPANEISKETCKSNETKQRRTKNNIRLRDKGKNWQPPNFEKAIKEGRKRLLQENQI